MNPTFIQIFIYVNIFLLGIVTVLAVRYARAHFKAQDTTPFKGPQQAQLSAAEREQLHKKASKLFQDQLDTIALEMQQDLKETAIELDGILKRLGVEIIDDEMKRYRAGLDELREAADTKLNAAQEAVVTHHKELDAAYEQRKQELDAKLQEEMTAEKARLSALIDTRLSQAVTSFLTETLSHNVDLGSQSAYLVSLLDEHKAELKKELEL